MHFQCVIWVEASSLIFARAKSLRANMTPTETKVWELLKSRYPKFKFRRQHPMGSFIADFYCHKLKLVIEMDGKHHYENETQKTRDLQRDEVMQKWGVKVLRYKNSVNVSVILKDIEQLIDEYKKANAHPTPKGCNRA